MLLLMVPLFDLISEQTVLKVAPLADEYKVDSVLRQCEDFLKDVCQRACDDKYSTMETSVLVDYVACAERYRMESVLPLAIRLCAERSARLLTEAGLYTMISPETAKLILESRDEMAEKAAKACLERGISFFRTVLKYISKLLYLDDPNKRAWYMCYNQ
jgi:hypothetical protein